MSGYTIEQVRDIARKHDYREITLNQVSRVISFRKDRVRINVYYTTGTVGTCVSHPVKGKTQLFRRNVRPSELDTLFANPRSHTGKGYYRKHVGQAWKNSANGTFLSDMARRWEYVAEMTGLSGHPRTLANLRRLMDELAGILWTRKTAPRLEQHSFDRRFLVSMALRQGILDGALGIVSNTQLSLYHSSRVEPSVKYLSEYRVDEGGPPVKTLDRQREMLRSLPKNLRKEICSWLIGMLEPDHVLVMKNYQLFAAAEPVKLAHLDYSKSFYTKRQLTYMDSYYGIIKSTIRNRGSS